MKFKFAILLPALLLFPLFFSACDVYSNPDLSGSSSESETAVPATASSTDETAFSLTTASETALTGLPATLPATSETAVSVTETTPTVSETKTDTTPGTSETSETTDARDLPVATPDMGMLNPYDISEEYESLYGEAFITVWRNLADAFLAFEPTFACPDEETFFQIYGCLDYCMPYFSCDASLSYDSFDPETGTVTIHYFSADRETHNAACEAFVNRIDTLLTDCIFSEESPLLTAISVYRSVCTNVTYTYSDYDCSVYTTLTRGTGDAFSISGALAYLFRQAGIPANVCCGISSDGRNTHQWTVFQIDGKWFYADPTFEAGETAGSGLSYFGINNAERAEAGFPESGLTIGVTGLVSASDYGVNHTDYDFFRGVTSFGIRPEYRELVISVDDITFSVIPFDEL